ncbi:MAG: acylphosphatase [Planctomycetaceae bacterium]|nr:acylphosphatase [Planctomycetaceae bacterium]
MTSNDSTENSNHPDPPLKVIYSGRVQGVGFRWTCQQISRRHDVRGTVRNLPDGTVELFADGDPKIVFDFLAEIESEMSTNIQNRTISPAPETVSVETFQIVR